MEHVQPSLLSMLLIYIFIPAVVPCTVCHSYAGAVKNVLMCNMRLSSMMPSSFYFCYYDRSCPFSANVLHESAPYAMPQTDATCVQVTVLQVCAQTLLFNSTQNGIGFWQMKSSTQRLLWAVPCIVEQHTLWAVPRTVEQHALWAVPRTVEQHALWAVPCIVEQHTLWAVPRTVEQHTLWAVPRNNHF
jgi:hypothetical protein